MKKTKQKQAHQQQTDTNTTYSELPSPNSVTYVLGNQP